MAVNSSQNRKTSYQLYAWISRIPAAWLLVLPLLLLIPTLGAFPYPALDAAYSDISISHYPNAIYLRQAITEFGTIPLWSPTIMSGYPFAANPLSGLWYPPGLLALILPLPLGFNLLIGLHLVLGGSGLYLLMRAEGLGKTAALLAGLSFGLLPKLFAHYGAGHLSLLYAVPWTPWLLLSQRRLTGSTGRFKIPPGLVLGLIFMADVRWGAFAMLTWWAYTIAHNELDWWYLIKNLIIQTVLALLLAAPLLVPLLELSALSTRAELSTSDVLTQSLPVMNLFGLFFPNLGTIHEWVFYSGGIVLLFALGGLLLSQVRRSRYFWGFLCLATILVAFGSQIPGAAWLAELPLVSLLRVPSRALFLTGLGIASLAGYGLEVILQKSPSNRVRIYGLTLFGISVFALLLLAGFGFISGEVAPGMLWGAVGLIASAAWIGLGLKSKLPAAVWIAGVFLIAMIDIMVFDLNSFVGKDAELVLSERQEAVQYIAEQGGDGRTYSPSYSLPQQTAVHFGLRMADGVDPLQVAEYAIFIDRASGVPRDGYSVTIPPFASGQPKTNNAAYSPDADRLGLLNVGYVVSDFDLQVEGLKFDRQIDNAFIYRNELKRYPAWIQYSDTAAMTEIQPAQVINRTPNWVEVSAVGPGILVLSEIFYPGWSVRVNGVEEEVLVQDEVLMGVKLGPGAQQIEFEFRPSSIYIGLLLSGVGLAMLAWTIWRQAKQVNRG